MEKVDILIKNANELITLKGLNSPRKKNEMSEIGIIQKGSVAIKDGIILDVGKNISYKAETVIDANGKIVMPGFIDSHTHLVFSGSREFELDWKLKGLSYLDIKKKGGGISYTVEKTRKASAAKLFDEARSRLDRMLSYGTTTCEAKSGYGLNTESELKILKVQKKLNSTHPVDIVSTFLGAHAIPKEYSASEYVKVIVDEMLPKVSKYAEFCDVFCEKGFFTYAQSKKILEESKKYDLTPKVHADEIVDTNGASLAAEVGAISAEHLLMTSDKGIKDMAKKEVIGVLLPGTPFSLMIKDYAPARKMIDAGVPVAFATDLNPNCYVENMQFIIQLACFNMKMTPAEAICASTFNAACAIGKQESIGSIEKGKQADIIILDVPNHLFIPYHFGVNHVEKVIKKGCVLFLDG
jgi:imidazolonepropionase